MKTTLEQFYKLFWNDKICQNVFLLHKELLLEKNPLNLKVTDYYLQRIVISNSLISKENAEEDLIFRKENRFIMVINNLKASQEKYLNSERFELLIKNKFGRAINLIRKEINEKNILKFLLNTYAALQDEKMMLSLLKEYKFAPDKVNTMEELGKHVETEIILEIKKFLKKQNFSHMFSSVDDISQYYHAFLKESLINGYQQNITVLIDKDNFKGRIELFDKLYEIGILIGGKFKSYFECINCPSETFNGFITCNILPSKIKVKCPQCGKDTNYLGPYFITNELFEQIIHKDGLLFFAITYLLNIYKIDYQSSINLEKCNELDFVLKNGESLTEILEVKMFKNDKSDTVKVKNLKEAIYQMKKSKNRLSEKDKKYTLTPFILITNISNKYLINTAKKELKDDLQKFNFNIFTPNEFYEFIKAKS